MELLLADAGEAIGEEVALPQLLLRLRGSPSLARRVRKLSRARNLAAHPDVRLRDQVVEFLIVGGGAVPAAKAPHAAPQSSGLLSGDELECSTAGDDGHGNGHGLRWL